MFIISIERISVGKIECVPCELKDKGKVTSEMKDNSFSLVQLCRINDLAAEITWSWRSDCVRWSSERPQYRRNSAGSRLVSSLTIWDLRPMSLNPTLTGPAWKSNLWTSIAKSGLFHNNERKPWSWNGERVTSCIRIGVHSELSLRETETSEWSGLGLQLEESRKVMENCQPWATPKLCRVWWMATLRLRLWLLRSIPLSIRSRSCKTH